MNTTALRQAGYPTFRALSWSPLVAVGGGLLVVAAALRLLDSRPGPVLALGAATMAAVLVASLRDPAASLLAAVPVPLRSAAPCAWPWSPSPRSPSGCWSRSRPPATAWRWHPSRR